MAALVWISTNLGAVLAAHVALQLMDRRRLGPTNDVKGDALMGIATEAPDFEIAITSIECVAERRRRLGRSLVTEHTLVPGFTGEPISLLARIGCSLR
jgi:hypothetical protein